jgi:hypothetical protein
LSPVCVTTPVMMTPILLSSSSAIIIIIDHLVTTYHQNETSNNNHPCFHFLLAWLCAFFNSMPCCRHVRFEDGSCRGRPWLGCKFGVTIRLPFSPSASQKLLLF